MGFVPCFGFTDICLLRDILHKLKVRVYTKTFIAQEKSLHRICPCCKKKTLITILTFDSREPPKNYKQIMKHRLLKFNY